MSKSANLASQMIRIDFAVLPVAICHGLLYQNAVFILCTSLSLLTSSCTLTIIVNVHELFYLEVTNYNQSRVFENFL